MQVILGDYLGSILGTVREGSDWCLDPLQVRLALRFLPSPRQEERS